MLFSCMCIFLDRCLSHISLLADFVYVYALMFLRIGSYAPVGDCCLTPTQQFLSYVMEVCCLDNELYVRSSIRVFYIHLRCSFIKLRTESLLPLFHCKKKLPLDRQIFKLR
jgi:hypothetical protein